MLNEEQTRKVKGGLILLIKDSVTEMHAAHKRGDAEKYLYWGNIYI